MYNNIFKNNEIRFVKKGSSSPLFLIIMSYPITHPALLSTHHSLERAHLSGEDTNVRREGYLSSPVSSHRWVDDTEELREVHYSPTTSVALHLVNLSFHPRHTSNSIHLLNNTQFSTSQPPSLAISPSFSSS